MKETNEKVITIPGMLEATLKPPCRKKARVVACGNYVQEAHDKQEVSAGGLDAIVTRSLVAMASRKQRAISTADVKTAGSSQGHSRTSNLHFAAICTS